MFRSTPGSFGRIRPQAAIPSAPQMQPGRYGGSVALKRWLATFFALLAGGQTITGGFTATSSNQGTKSSGTFTLDNTVSNFQYYTNGGAHTLAPPANHCTMVVDVLNGGASGAVTTTGWTKVDGSFDTTSTSKFRCYGSVGQGGSHLSIVKLA